MRKISILLLCVLMSAGIYAQRYRVQTHEVQNTYKKHYSHSIEGGYVNGSAREFVAGNKTDMISNSYEITGHAFQTGFLSGKWFKDNSDHEILLTDFTIMPSDNYQYGAGTGVYYPLGITGMGYPYIGVYDKITMEVLYAWYYTVTFPGSGHSNPGHSIGLRIIYSDDENAFYVSGVMTDQLFPELNMNNLTGKSKGFILKAYFGSMQTPELFVFPLYFNWFRTCTKPYI
jgi:hypothetical protein